MKNGQILDRMNGKMRESSGDAGILQPYMNMFFLRECPWKSVKSINSRSLANAWIICLVQQMVGWRTFDGAFQRLFKSQPAREHRQFPLITPSGFNIGTILNTKFYQRISASGMSVLVKQSRAPFIIQEPTDSPGCTLAVRTTPLRLFMFSGFCLLVMVKISRGLPARV